MFAEDSRFPLSPIPGSGQAIAAWQTWSELLKSTENLYLNFLKLYFGIKPSACKRDNMFNVKFAVMLALRILLRSYPLHEAMSPLRGL